MSISTSLTTAPTPTPQRNSSDFRTEADAYVDWQANTFVPEMNTIITDFNATIQNLFVGTSTTSETVGTGSKTLTMVEDNLAFGVGSSVKIADTAAPTTNYMEGEITAYSKTTKIMTVNVTTSGGSGTKTAWTVTLLPPDENARVTKWSDLTGAASVPLVTYHSSSYWVLLNNLADVTASEPGVTTDWLKLGTFLDYTEYTSTESEWEPEDGATWVRVQLIGAGGGGRNVTGAAGNDQGGCGGEFVEYLFRVSDLTTPLDITIGAGGVGGADAGDNDGTDGGDSTFGSYLTASGGSGGSLGAYAGLTRGSDPSSMATSSVYGHVFRYYGPGGSGEYSAGRDTIWGGGGGAGTQQLSGGTSDFHGDGGDGNASASSAADNGTAPGGGGGASANDGGGGDGADGSCRIWQW